VPIYDQSYAHWKGRLEGRIFRWLPITLKGIRLAFRSKVFIVLFILGLIPLVVRAGMIVSYHYVSGMETNMRFAEAIKADSDFYHRFLLTEQMFGIIVMCVFAGSPLLSRDMKSGALEIYFSKPLMLLDYLMGKFMVMAFFLACMTLFPALFLFLLDLLLSEEPGHFSEVVGNLPRILAVSGLVIFTCSLLVMAASGVTRTPRTAAMVWVAFHVALCITAHIAAEIVVMDSLELLDVRVSLKYLSELIFGCEDMGYSLQWYVPLLYLAFLMGGSFAVLLRKVRGVEVIRS